MVDLRPYRLQRGPPRAGRWLRFVRVLRGYDSRAAYCYLFPRRCRKETR